MNKQGMAYCSKAKSLADKFGGFDPQDSPIQERMMRCGVEEDFFELEAVSEIRQVAIATLRQDFSRMREQYEQFQAG